MRILRNIVLGLVAVVVILAAASYLLPRHVTVERSVTIDAPPNEVFPEVNSLQRASEWSPWLAADPETELAYSGPEEGVGNRLEWSSENPRVGSGSQEITASEPDERVETALDFGDMGTGRAWFDLAPQDGATEVTWGLVADMGNSPVGRYMGLMMDDWVGADYERGLQNLRATVEGQ